MNESNCQIKKKCNWQSCILRNGEDAEKRVCEKKNVIIVICSRHDTDQENLNVFQQNKGKKNGWTKNDKKAKLLLLPQKKWQVLRTISVFKNNIIKQMLRTPIQDV